MMTKRYINITIQRPESREERKRRALGERVDGLVSALIGLLVSLALVLAGMGLGHMAL